MIERKYMAHYVDSGFTSTATSGSYVRLGTDLEEFNIELNPDIETGKNILGESTFHHNGYEESGSVEPYYAEDGDDLFEALQTKIDTRATGDDLKSWYVEVHLWETAVSGAYPAWAQP